tara:strand:- start:1074 stop:1874 length:801 start_codon:yes stop_codon:yes gene_type:complete
MNENSSFASFSNKQKGLLFDDSNDKNYPIKYHNFIGTEEDLFKGKEESTYHVYVYSGELFLQNRGMPVFVLRNEFYFSVHGEFLLSGNGQAIVIETLVKKEGSFYAKNNYTAMFHIGKAEDKGRLKYIDGCTDSLLIPPVKLGDACLNHLHFPANIDQTAHTHPSHRIGVVAKGNGMCKTPFGNMELTQGMIFVIKCWDGVSYSTGLDGQEHPNGEHSFETFENNMDVIAYHPDSDFGATDEMHPMINRTIVGGISASQLEDIRTK